MASDASVPLISGNPDKWPTHVKQGIASATGEAAVDRHGRQVPYKVGSKFVAHRSELLGPDGNLLPVLPLYADTLKAGKIILPFSGSEYEAHGGPGYGAIMDRYGDKAWASLHYPRQDGSTATMGSPARRLSKIIHETTQKHGGAIGLVYNGGRGAARGNRSIWLMIHHELQHMAANGMGDAINKAIAAEPSFKAAGVESLADLPRVLGYDTPTAVRGEMIGNLLKRGPNAKKDKGSPLSQAVHWVLDAALDYQHVPDYHGVAVVRFHPGGGLSHDTTDNPVYHHQAHGVYLGELQHSIPLSELLPESYHTYVKERGKIGYRHLQTRTQSNPNMTDPSTPRALASVAKAVLPDSVPSDDPEEIEKLILREAMRPGRQARLQEALHGAVAGGRPERLASRVRLRPLPNVAEEVGKAIGFRTIVVIKGADAKRDAKRRAKECGATDGDTYCPECGAVYEWDDSEKKCNGCGSHSEPSEYREKDSDKG